MIEVKTLTKSRYHKGLKVIVGGTRLRWLGFIGSRDKPERWLQIFVMDFIRNFLLAFATGNLYVLGWRVIRHKFAGEISEALIQSKF